MEDIIKKLKKLSINELDSLQTSIQSIIFDKNNEYRNKVNVGDVYIEKYNRFGGYTIFKITYIGLDNICCWIDRFDVDIDGDERDLNSDVTIVYDEAYTVFLKNLVKDIMAGKYEKVDSTLYDKVSDMYYEYVNSRDKLDRDYFKKFKSIV